MYETDPMFDVGFNGIATLVAIGFLIVISVILHKLFDYLVSMNSKEISVTAKLIEKSASEHSSFDANTNMNHTSVEYYLIFETEDKERLVFTTNKKKYLEYVQGDLGTLKYKRKIFVNFVVRH